MFGAFLKIGATAFGGGSATTAAIRQTCLSRGWLTEDEFLDTIVLSRVTPGITILAQTLLIGWRVCGARGAAGAAFGLLLPAIVITIALSETYVLVSGSSLAVMPLLCVAGIASGFAVAVALQLLRDTLRRSHRVLGPLMFLVYLGLSVLVGNPVIVLVIAIAAGLLVPALFDGGASDES